MAIIDGIHGLEIVVLVDGQPLREYEQPPDDNDDNDKRVTRYVVAEPGKKFAVLIKRKRGFKHGGPKWDISSRLYIDGTNVKSLLTNKSYYPDGLGEQLFSEVETEVKKGKWEKREFMFSDLVFDNDEAQPITKEQIDKAKKLGEIRMTLRRGTIGAVTTATANDTLETKKVHEKVLKGRAMSRKAGLTEATAAKAPTFRDFSDYDAQPFAEFIFRYRSERDLKSEMIIPRSPSPVPFEDRPDEDLTHEELLRRMRELRENDRIKLEGQRGVKRERTSTVMGDDDEIEVVDPAPKRPRVIETIDLSDD